MKRLIHLSVLIALMLLISGCDRKPAIEPSGKKIKVGIIAPFSGADRARGEEGVKGIKTAMQLLPYLDNGDGIELVREDAGDDPALAVRLLKKLAEVDKVSAIITFSSSGPVLAMADVADTYKIPILAALATHPDTTGHNDYVSQLCFDDIFQGMVSALFVRDELLFDEVAIFTNPDSPHSSKLAAQFEHKFKSIDGEIVDTIFLTGENKDLADTMEALRHKKPDLLYLPIGAEAVIRIIKAAENLNWKPEMMGSDGLIAEVVTKHREELGLLDGMLATDFFHSDMPLTRFGRKVRAIYKGQTTSYAVLGVEGYALLLHALNRCGDSADRECINNQIRSTANFTGVTGKITIGPDGKAQRPLSVNSIRNGKMKFVVKVY